MEMMKYTSTAVMAANTLCIMNRTAWYKFGTIKGYVTVRWYGESNGYYSEEVNFERVM